MSARLLSTSSSQRLLEDILALKGYDLARIAKEARLSRRTLQSVRLGQTEDLHFNNFSKLLALHCVLFARASAFPDKASALHPRAAGKTPAAV